MKNKSLIAVLSAALLGAGCTHWFGGEKGSVDPRFPQVSLVNGKVTAPAALVFLPGMKDVDITWQLPKDSKLRFAPKGIEIDGVLLDSVIKGPPKAVELNPNQQEVRCPDAPGDKGLTYTCKNVHSKPGIYKYTIRVIDESGKVIPLDPTIVNM